MNKTRYYQDQAECSASIAAECGVGGYPATKSPTASGLLAMNKTRYYQDQAKCSASIAAECGVGGYSATKSPTASGLLAMK